MKKLRWLVVLTVMLALLLPAYGTVFCSSVAGFEYENGVLVKYVGKSSVVVIPSTLNVATIGDNAFKDNKTVTEVVIPSTVRTLGKGVFTNCTSLKKVVIPATVTYISDYGNTFAGCDNLNLTIFGVAGTVAETLAAITPCTFSNMALPEPPKNIKVTTVTDTYADVTWDAVKGAIGYNIFVGTTKQNNNLVTTNHYRVLGLEGEKKYDIVIRTVNNAGQSKISKAVSTTTTKDVTPPLAIIYQLSDSAAVISYSDDGIATLNGEPVENGVTIQKPGDYTLIVKDKAGNPMIRHFTLKAANANSFGSKVVQYLWVIILVVVLALAIGGYFLWRSMQNKKKGAIVEETDETDSEDVQASEELSETTEEEAPQTDEDKTDKTEE